MRRINYIILIVLATVLFSCQKDPMADINEGNWNKERNIITIALQNQLGPATIVRDDDGATITAFVNAAGLDLSAVKVDALVLSFDASANVEAGGTLNFNNADSKAEITVTSKTGESLVWNIVVEQYDMFYTGSWKIGQELIYINQEWGSKWSESVTKKFTDAAPEFDNSVEINYEGYKNGRTYGTINNKSGADGAYGKFIASDVDLTSKLRFLIPEGESKWEMDLASNTFYVTKDGKTSEAKVTKTDTGIHLVYVLKYKPEEPFWDYGAHDNYLCWSYQFDIDLSK